MKGLQLVAAVLLLLTVSLTAQTRIDLATYLVGQVGDTLAFTNLSVDTPSTHFVYYEATDNAFLTVKESNGDAWTALVNEQGWQVAAVRLSGQMFRFEHAITLLPIQPTRGKTYRHTTSVNNGQVHLQTLMLGIEAAETPLRNFVDCLKIQHFFTFKSDGRSLTHEFIAWYARGIGLVKFIKKTNTGSQQKVIAALLQDAVIQGKPLAGRRKN